MDLVSITRFESISKDLHRLEDKLKQSGIQSLELKFQVPGKNEQSSMTLFPSSSSSSATSSVGGAAGVAGVEYPSLSTTGGVSSNNLTPIQSSSSSVSSSSSSLLPKNISPITQQFDVTNGSNNMNNTSSHWFPGPHMTSPDNIDHNNYKILHPIEIPPPSSTIHTKRRIFIKILYQIYRGFSIGFIGKFAFNFLPILIKKGPLAIFTHLSLQRCLNPGWWGLFSGSFLGIFHTIMQLTKRSQDFTKHQRSFFAAFCSAWTLLFIPKQERTGVAVFMFVRALETIARAGYEAGILPYIPHADALLFAVATAQIVFSWIFAPFAQNGGYNNFLSTHTGNRAQGTQQALAYLHINAPINFAHNTVKIGEQTITLPPQATPNSEPLSLHLGTKHGIRSPLGHYQQHESGIITIPGGVVEGQRMGYTKVKGWENGLSINDTIDFYAKRNGKHGLKGFDNNVDAKTKTNLLSTSSSSLSSSTTLSSPSSSLTHPITQTPTNPLSQSLTQQTVTSVLTTPLVSLLTSPGTMASARKALAMGLDPSTFLHTPLTPDHADFNPFLPQSTITNAPAGQRPSQLSLLPDELVKICNHWHKHRGQAPLLPQNLTDRSKLMCQILHPKCPNHCLGGQIAAYPGVIRQGIKTYAPVYIIPGLLFRYQILLNDPQEWFYHTLTSTLQSAAFFSNMTLLSHVFSCYSRHILNFIGSRYAYHYYLMPGLTGLAAFIAVLLEQKSKRIELALFSLSHALRSLTKLLLVSERIPLIPWANTALFSVSIAVLISAAMTNPTLLRSSYFSLLRLWLGRDTPGLVATPKDLSVSTSFVGNDEGEIGLSLNIARVVGSNVGSQTDIGCNISSHGSTHIGSRIGSETGGGSDFQGQPQFNTPQQHNTSTTIYPHDSKGIISSLPTSSSSSIGTRTPNTNKDQWLKDVLVQDLALATITRPTVASTNRLTTTDSPSSSSSSLLTTSNMHNNNSQSLNNSQNNGQNNQNISHNRSQDDRNLKHIESYTLFTPTPSSISPNNSSPDEILNNNIPPLHTTAQQHVIQDNITDDGISSQNAGGNGKTNNKKANNNNNNKKNDNNETYLDPVHIESQLSAFHRIQRRASIGDEDAEPMISPYLEENNGEYRN